MTSTLFDLTGQVAVITGASRGLGQYFGRALAKAGADLIVTSRHKDDLLPFVAEIEGLGRKAIPLELDVRDQGSIEAMAASVEALGQVHILVNNAGCNVRKPALEVTWDDWNLILETNLRGSFFVVAADCETDGAARLWADRQYRLGDKRVRLCGAGALWGEPRWHSTAYDEPGR